MTKEDAEFERFLSDKIVREVGRILGYKRLKFYEHGGQQRHATAWVTRIYGQRLTIPYAEGWDAFVTITVWNGQVKADFSRGQWDGGVYESINDGEFSFDAADPDFIDAIAQKLRESIAKGKPEF